MQRSAVRVAAMLSTLGLALAGAHGQTDDPTAHLNTPGPVTVRAEWSLGAGAREGDYRSVIHILFKRPKGDPRGEDVGVGLLQENSPALHDARLWKVIASQNGKSEPVRFSVEPYLGVSQRGGVKSIVLTPEKTPSNKTTYTVSLANPASSLNFRPGWRLTNAADAAKLIPDNQLLEIDEGFINGNKALEPRIAIHTGADSGVSLNAQFGFRDWNNGDRWRLQGLFTADGTYRPKDSGHYIDSTVGELDFVTVRHFGDARATGNFIGISELGIASRIETDQELEKVNGTIGVTWWNTFNHPLIQGLGRVLCLTRNVDEHSQIPTPIFVLAYDYVYDIHDDLATGERVTEVGQHRLRGKFYWSAKLAHDLAIPLVSASVSSNYDVDLAIEVGGIFDVEESKFNPDTRIGLEISPTTPGDSKPSFTLTYVNGKTTPKFEHYDAIFAGWKLPF